MKKRKFLVSLLALVLIAVSVYGATMFLFFAKTEVSFSTLAMFDFSDDDSTWHSCQNYDHEWTFSNLVGGDTISDEFWMRYSANANYEYTIYFWLNVTDGASQEQEVGFDVEIQDNSYNPISNMTFQPGDKKHFYMNASLDEMLASDNYAILLTVDGSETFGGETFPPQGGDPPAFSSETPANESTDISISTAQLSITIEDAEGELFDWSITTSPNVGSSSGTDESNGTKTCSISGLSYSTTYYWTVSANNGGEDPVTAVYHFTTEAEPPAYDYYVDDDFDSGTPGWQTTHFDDIQDAVTACSADETVYVYDGTYGSVTSVTVTNIVVTAESQSAIISSTSNALELGTSSGSGFELHGFSLVSTDASTIQIHGADNVVIDGCDIDGGNSGAQTAIRIESESGGCTITNNDIHGAAGNGLYILSTAATGNSIYYNNFYSNSGHNAEDAKGSNSFDDGGTGNAWDDWTSNPYSIPGGGGSTDNYGSLYT